MDRHTDAQTDIRTDGTDFIPSTADAGGQNTYLWSVTNESSPVCRHVDGTPEYCIEWVAAAEVPGTCLWLLSPCSTLVAKNTIIISIVVLHS